MGGKEYGMALCSDGLRDPASSIKTNHVLAPSINHKRGTLVERNHSHVVILNWRSPEETIACLENIRDVGLAAKIVVIDNASGDDSVAQISAWLDSTTWRRLTLLESEAETSEAHPDNYDVVLIENSANHGFAGGTRSGIKFAATRANSDVVWLLNNDARINEHTFPALHSRLMADPELGFVGSVIRFYEQPDHLQCFGGIVMYPRLGKGALYKKNSHISKLPECEEAKVDSIMGASIAFRKQIVEDIGTMEEAYFMYSEEVDWQLRAKERGWKIGVEPSSHIFHKGAHSTRGRSHMYHYYLNRSSVMLSKRFFGTRSLLTVVPSLAFIVFMQNWVAPRNVVYGWKGICSGFLFRWQT
jgi:GT2 family glycosyltransferase